MSQDGVNKGRRTLLVGATAGVGAVGAGFLAVPFVKSWLPSEKAKAAGAPAKVDISNNQVINDAVTAAETELAGRGRVLLRPSGTEPLIRVMVEGEDQALVNKLVASLAETVE